MESKTLKEIVKEIQYKKDLTIEEVADSIGYSRVHLTKALKKGSNENMEKLLKEKYKDILQKDSPNGNQNDSDASQDSNKPLGGQMSGIGMGMSAGTGNLTAKDYRLLYEEALERLSNRPESPQVIIERLDEIEAKLSGFLVQATDLLSKQKRQIGTLAQNVGRRLEELGNTPIVKRRPYKKKDNVKKKNKSRKGSDIPSASG